MINHSLDQLPFELIYRILDHLDEIDVLLSVRPVCQQLTLVTETYQRYQVNHDDYFIDACFRVYWRSLNRSTFFAF